MAVGRHPEVLWRSTSDGPVLLGPGHDRPVALTGLTAVVWLLLDEPTTVAGLASEAAELLGPLPSLRGQVDAMVASSLLVPADGRLVSADGR